MKECQGGKWQILLQASKEGRALEWADLSPCQEDILHATSRTYLDAAFKGVGKDVLEEMGLLGHTFSKAKRGK